MYLQKTNVKRLCEPQRGNPRLRHFFISCQKILIEMACLNFLKVVDLW